MTDAIRFGGVATGAGPARLFQRLLHAFCAIQDALGPKDAAVTSLEGESSPGPHPQHDVAQLYRKYAGSLYWVCLKYVRNKEDAEDMVNQVFVKVQQNLAGFKGRSRIYSWMYRIAVNECIQLYRKRKYESQDEGNFEEFPHASPEGRLEARLVLERIARDSDPQTVEILFLVYLEGLTQLEVVEKLGISRATVYRKLSAFKAGMEAYL